MIKNPYLAQLPSTEKLRKPMKVALDLLLAFDQQEYILQRDWNKMLNGLWALVDYKLHDPFNLLHRRLRTSCVKNVRERYALFAEKHGRSLHLTNSTSNAQHWEAHLSALRELARLKGVSMVSELIGDTAALIGAIEALLPLARLVDTLYPRVRTLGEIRAAQERAEVAAQTSPQVQAAIAMIAEDFRRVVQAGFEDYFNLLLRLWREAVREKGGHITSPSALFAKEDAKRRADLSALLVKGENAVWAAPAPAALKALAAERAKAEIEEFAYKMAFKLGGLFPKTTVDIVAQKLSGNHRTNNILFVINGGESSFVLRNQIVDVVNRSARPFYRFPTTFHDLNVKGEVFFDTSEQEVKERLNEAYSGQGVDPCA